MVGALNQQNLVLPTGTVKIGALEYDVALNGSPKSIKEMNELPIKTISVPELIDYLGYKAKERTIPLGADSKGSDFKPRNPDQVQRKSTNNMFKRERATPTWNTKSAY